MVFWSEDVDCIRLRALRVLPMAHLYPYVPLVALVSGTGLSWTVFLRKEALVFLVPVVTFIGVFALLASLLLELRDSYCWAWLEMDVHGLWTRSGDSRVPFEVPWCAVQEFFPHEDLYAGWEVHARLAGGRTLRMLGDWTGSRREVECLVRRLNELI